MNERDRPPSVSRPPAERADESGRIIDIALLGSLMGSVTCGMGALMGGALLGALGARLGQTLGEGGVLRGGALGAAIAGALWPRAITGCFKPTRGTAGLFLAVFVAAAAFYRFIGYRIDGTFYPWALAAGVPALFLGAAGEPMRLASGGTDKTRGRARLFVEVVLLLAFILKGINVRLAGAISAGALGGLFGGAFITAILYWRGGAETMELLGGTPAFFAGGCICSSAAACLGRGARGESAPASASQLIRACEESEVGPFFPGPLLYPLREMACRARHFRKSLKHNQL
jgi:hypothetical protein